MNRRSISASSSSVQMLPLAVLQLPELASLPGLPAVVVGHDNVGFVVEDVVAVDHAAVGAGGAGRIGGGHAHHPKGSGPSALTNIFEP
jgi:hypothetical protein